VTEPDDDELLAELAHLPRHDTDAASAERIRRATVDAFVETKAAEGHPWRAFAARGARLITPVLVAGTVGVYLSWAVAAANALFP